ncbi:efflux transporter periplasmic adaptor subunit [filamentous cyanobacterium CCP2]|nr:efflux transporter periplasmic adaptor subunit [filamentous cyanobacterium CCP2]
MLLLALPGVAIAHTQFFRNAAEPTQSVQPLSVETVRLKPASSYEVRRTYTGEIVARRSSELGFEQSGTVIELLLAEGDTVTANQPLARLDTRSLQAQRQQLIAQRDQALAQLQELETGARPETIAAARAAVADLEQQVALAQLQKARREGLYQEGAIAREDLDQQTFNLGSLQNRLNQAQSQLDELLAGTRQEQVMSQQATVRQLDASLQAIEIELEKSVLRSPFSGRVSQRLVDEGVVVSGGQSVLRLVEGGELEARIGVPVDMSNRLTIGSPQSLQVGNQSYDAQITALLPELDTNTRTVTIVLQFSPESDVAIGQTAQLLISDTQPEDGYWLPATALVPSDRGLWSVYVVNENDADETKGSYVVARRDVEVLHTKADDSSTQEQRVFVRGLLQPGERAIVTGTHRIVSGQTVTVSP